MPNRVVSMVEQELGASVDRVLDEGDAVAVLRTYNGRIYGWRWPIRRLHDPIEEAMRAVVEFHDQWNSAWSLDDLTEDDDGVLWLYE